MLQRKTQSADFWRNELEIGEELLTYLYQLVLDQQRPLSTDELALALIERLVQQEDSRLRRELARGPLYQPKDVYEVGQQVVFPTLGFVAGEVISIRPGFNPEHGEFSVIRVRFPDSKHEREFAAGLTTPHKLNRINGDDVFRTLDMLSPRELLDQHRDVITAKLITAMREDVLHDFLALEDQWIVKDLLADVNVGHLHIAEALIEMRGEPVSTDELLPELDLPAEVSPEMQRLSVDIALANDERFDQVGPAGKRLWYLQRLEPAEVFETPPLLRYEPISYNQALLTVEMLQTEWELADEWSADQKQPDETSLVPSTTFLLTYPHRASGTLPLSSRTAPFFPTGSNRMMVTLIDGRWGNRFNVWIVPQGRYICGPKLADWMEQHKLPVSAFITLERSQDGKEIILDYTPRRMRRVWGRMAAVEKNQLVFQMQKLAVACDYDDHLLVGAEDEHAILALSEYYYQEGYKISDLVDLIFPELAKLSPQGTVHIKTLYSSVNLVRRCPPGPIFYALVMNRQYADRGNGYYALA